MLAAGLLNAFGQRPMTSSAASPNARLLEHFAVLRPRSTAPIPWNDVVRIEGKRIVVRDR